MSEQQKVAMSEELALGEVKKWAEANDIEITAEGDDGAQKLDAAVPKLVRAVQQGRLVVNESGDFEYTVSASSPAGFAGEVLKFTAPTGAAYLGMDKYKGDQGFHKLMAVASAMTGKDVAWFSKLHNRDYKIVVYVAGFFIGG